MVPKVPAFEEETEKGDRFVPKRRQLFESSFRRIVHGEVPF
jgi:hypothetical protein